MICSNIALILGDKGGLGVFFFGGFGNSYFIFFFYVYMSKCRQFKGLSTGMSILITPAPPPGTSSFLKEKNKLKYLSIQLLIRGTCRVTTGGKSKCPDFP